MIIPLEPRLEGRAESRFFSFAQQMLDRQAAEGPERIGDLVRSETHQAPRLQDLEGQRDEYTACVGVVGDLGTGKTQLTKALIYRFRQQAARNRGHAPKFLIFDYKRDYTKSDFVRAVDARVVSPHRIPLNVFDLPSARGHLPVARLGRVKFLNDVLQKIYGGIGPRQRNHLKTAVMRAYEAAAGAAPTLTDVVRTYADLVGDRVDAPYSILSDLDDLEVFVDRAADAQPFDEFFSGVTVIDLAALGIGDKERNMLLVRGITESCGSGREAGGVSFQVNTEHPG